MAAAREVGAWLLNKGIEVRAEWLQACLQWVQAEEVGLL